MAWHRQDICRRCDDHVSVFMEENEDTRNSNIDLWVTDYDSKDHQVRYFVQPEPTTKSPRQKARVRIYTFCYVHMIWSL